MIRKYIAILMVMIMLCGCHGAARNYGGSMTLELPKGQKLEEITWKDDSALWYLTRPMRDDEQPETKVVNVAGNYNDIHDNGNVNRA